MISEITFAKKFTSFWNEMLPNAKNYVRLVNSGYRTALYAPINEPERKNNIALINVIYFDLYRAACLKQIKAESIRDKNFMRTDEFYEVAKKSLNYISKFSYGNNCQLPLTTGELNQIQLLFKLLSDQIPPYQAHVIIDPLFDGCGFLNSAQGDILANNKLIEIKSGQRTFSLVDFRQVIIYLTLNHYSRNPRVIEEIELFNPRMGISFSDNVENLCKNLSSLDYTELFSEVQKFITENNFIEEFSV